MSHELVRALRAVYDDVEGSATGQPARQAIASLWTLLGQRAQQLQVLALWSAARALILPQIAAGAIDPGLRAITALRAAAAAAPGPQAQVPADIAALLAGSTATTDDRQLQAQRCLGHALAFLLQPTPAGLMAVIDAMVSAQRSEFAHSARAHQAWIGWLDDVASRCDRFTPAALLDLLERTLRGTLTTMPVAFRWEGTGDDKGLLHVWAADLQTRRLVSSVMTIDPPVRTGRLLQVTVHDAPHLVRDPLRIEYFVEHTLHRVFLGEPHAGQFDRIDYHCLGTGEAWSAPA